ncbi:MAG: hypothetical protein C7M88_01350 [Candidatus Arcticimaribacter sp.]|nr:MAG: hypothetical protein C7M88_01350 [Candidatus Arcticimaribacter sp.]
MLFKNYENKKPNDQNRISMKNSIEYLLNSLARFLEKEKPRAGHEQRFLAKLQGQKKTMKTSLFKTYYWSAAALIAFVSFAAGSQFFAPNVTPSNDFDKATVYYTQYIDKQLAAIDQEENAEYTVLIADGKEQLARLELEYQKLMDTFKNNAVHPLLIQAMIENLQHRSVVLYELEEKINTLKNTNYEKEVL